MLSEELVAAFLIGFALGASIRNEQLNKATEQRDRAENMLRNVSKEYAEVAGVCERFAKIARATLDELPDGNKEEEHDD